MAELAAFRGAARVTRGSEVLIDAASGLADDATNIACTASTRFQISSVSKQFVAAAVLLLVQDGALSLDDSITRFFPEAPTAWGPITLHHLLTHTAGLGHWPDLPGFDIDDPPKADDLLRVLFTGPVLHPPGTTWSYSGPAYLLAAWAVERVTDASYHRFVGEQIFTPLGMTSTSSGIHPTDDAAARGYLANGSAAPAVPALAAMPGTGDMWSTTSDLNRYSDAVRLGELLTPQMTAAMLTSHATARDVVAPRAVVVSRGYGYGCFLGTVCGQMAHFHPGDNPGYHSLHASVPTANVSIALLSNCEATHPDDVLRPLCATLLGA